MFAAHLISYCSAVRLLPPFQHAFRTTNLITSFHYWPQLPLAPAARGPLPIETHEASIGTFKVPLLSACALPSAGVRVSSQSVFGQMKD